MVKGCAGKLLAGFTAGRANETENGYSMGSWGLGVNALANVCAQVVRERTSKAVRLNADGWLATDLEQINSQKNETSQSFTVSVPEKEGRTGIVQLVRKGDQRFVTWYEPVPSNKAKIRSQVGSLVTTRTEVVMQGDGDQCVLQKVSEQRSKVQEDGELKPKEGMDLRYDREGCIALSNQMPAIYKALKSWQDLGDALTEVRGLEDISQRLPDTSLGIGDTDSKRNESGGRGGYGPRIELLERLISVCKYYAPNLFVITQKRIQKGPGNSTK